MESRKIEGLAALTWMGAVPIVKHQIVSNTAISHQIESKQGVNVGIYHKPSNLE
jgi:hypothetical protein